MGPHLVIWKNFVGSHLVVWKNFVGPHLVIWENLVGPHFVMRRPCGISPCYENTLWDLRLLCEHLVGPHLIIHILVTMIILVLVSAQF